MEAAGPSPARAAAGAHPRKNIRDEFLRLARGPIPGFGGIYYDSAGNPVVYLKDAALRGQAQRELAFLLGVPRYAGRHGGLARKEIVVRAARYDYVQLDEWYGRVLSGIAGTAGIVSSAIQDSRNHIVIGVRDEAARGAVRARLAGIDVPTAAVEVEVVPAQKPLIGAPVSVRDTFQNVPGGVRIMFREPSTGVLSGCTSGVNVGDAGDPSVRWLLVNSHCTGTMGSVHATRPTMFFQPLDNAGDTLDLSRFIGNEVWDPPFDSAAHHYMWYVHNSTPQCPSGYVCRAADVAFVRYAAGAGWDLGGIARPAVLNNQPGGNQSQLDPYAQYILLNTQNPTFRIRGVDWYAVEGETVHKVGGTSGWSSGTVVTACGAFHWNDGLSPAPLTLCTQSVSGGAGAVSGDSGGPVFRNHGDGTVTLLGLAFAGSQGWMTYSPWGGILNEFPPMSGFPLICSPNLPQYGSCF